MKANNTVKWVWTESSPCPSYYRDAVAGFFLLLLFSLRRPFGAWLYAEWGIKGIDLARLCHCCNSDLRFIPLMYRNVRAAFEQVDVNLIHCRKDFRV